MGKGSAPRKGANQKAYEENWDKIFGSKEDNGIEGVCPECDGSGCEHCDGTGMDPEFGKTTQR